MHVRYIEQQSILGNIDVKLRVKDSMTDGPESLGVMLKYDNHNSSTLQRKLSYWLVQLVGNGRVDSLYTEKVLKQACLLPRSCVGGEGEPTDAQVEAAINTKQQAFQTTLTRLDIPDLFGPLVVVIAIVVIGAAFQVSQTLFDFQVQPS